MIKTNQSITKINMVLVQANVQLTKMYFMKMNEHFLTQSTFVLLSIDHDIDIRVNMNIIFVEDKFRSDSMNVFLQNTHNYIKICFYKRTNLGLQTRLSLLI